jgi:putative ABC transport system permease protein
VIGDKPLRYSSQSSLVSWVENWADSVLVSIKRSIRRLGRSLGFTFTSLLIYCIAIIILAPVLTTAWQLWLQPLPYPRSKQLTVLWTENVQQGHFDNLVAPANFVDWRGQSKTFQDLAGFRRSHYVLEGATSGAYGAEDVTAALVSSNFFQVLEVKSLIGRSFSAVEQSNGDSVAVISEKLWLHRFGANPSVLGQFQKLNGKAYQIIGVMPDRVQFPQGVDLWIPLSLSNREIHDRQIRNIYVVGRIKEDTTIRTAQAEMSALNRNIDTRASRRGWDVRLRPLYIQMVQHALPVLLFLAASVFLLLLIASTNIVVLMLARASSQKKAGAIKVALGATPFQLAKDSTYDFVMLVGISALVSCVGLQIGLPVVRKMLSPETSAVLHIYLDYKIFLCVVTLTLLISIISGVLPLAIRSRSRHTSSWLRTLSASTMTPRQGRVIRLVSLVQVALFITLSIATCAIAQRVKQLLGVHLGFEPEHLLAVGVLPSQRALGLALSGHPAGKLDPGVTDLNNAMEQLASLPGVREVATIDALPLTGDYQTTTFAIPGQPGSFRAENSAELRQCTNAYFQTMRIPLIAGRGFGAGDGPGAPPVAVVNRTMAQLWWKNANPTGQTIRISIMGSDTTVTIVGIVEDVTDLGLAASSKAQIYIPFQQHSFLGGRFVLRTTGNPFDLATATIRSLQEVLPDFPLVECRSMDEILSSLTLQERTLLHLLGLMSILAVGMAVFGIYSVSQYLFLQRRGEAAIRLALGATSMQILRLYLRSIASISCLGSLVGLISSLVILRVLRHHLQEFPGLSLAPILAVVVVGTAVVMFAAFWPAREIAASSTFDALRES